MRTGGMTKGLLGFIGGVWSYIQRPKVPPAKAARTPNVILNKVYKAKHSVESLLYQNQSVIAESGEGGESSAQTCSQQQPYFGRKVETGR